MFAPTVRTAVHEFRAAQAAAMARVAEINRSLKSCSPPVDLTISTMNVMCRLSVQQVRLHKVKELFADPDTKRLADEAFRTSVELQQEHEFHNCVIVKYQVKDPAARKAGTVAIKLFVNGTTQISGCRRIQDALMNGQLLCRFLEGMAGIEPGSYTVVDFAVHMVNCNFVLGVPGPDKKINLTRLHDHVRRHYRLFLRYDSSVHAALRITKVSPVVSSSRITIMVFSNAQCIITGWKRWEDLVDAYHTVLHLVDEAYEEVVPPQIRAAALATNKRARPAGDREEPAEPEPDPEGEEEDSAVGWDEGAWAAARLD